jgi:acetyl esterase
MSLDAATRNFLDVLRSANLPPLYKGTIEAARAGMKANVAQLPGTPDEVHRVEDRTVPGAGHQIPVRLYWPRAANAGERLPIVVHFHGGGWAMGDLDTHDRIARSYCKQADAIVVNVDYRRPPEHKFPAAVDDSYLATCWAAEHAGEIGGDPARIAVAGDSAGGNLAAVVCQLAKANKRPAIAFQALVYPATDLDLSKSYESREKFGGGEYFLSTRDMEWFAAFYLTNAQSEVSDPRASPLAAKDLSGLPPAVVITAGYDPLRDEGRAYADRLKAAGVPVDYRCFEGTIHAFLSFAPIIPAGEEGLAFVASRLRNALRNPVR